MRFLIWGSVILYILELFIGSKHSLESPLFFLWAERIIATIFTLEIFYRYRKEDKYLFSPMFWVDVLAVVPFYVGFFVNPEYLGLIRTLRVLRLLKLFRYNKSMQRMLLTFVRAWPCLKGALICLFIICLFSSALLHEFEGKIQPEKFGNIFDCFYYCVTVSNTVGLGDMSTITTMGRAVTIICLYGPAVAICAAIIGIIGAAYIEEQDNQTNES